MLGYALFTAALATAAYATTATWIVVCFILYGLAYASTEGTSGALVAEVCGGLKGTGMGLYHAFTGLALILGNTLAGALWELLSPLHAFMYAASISALALASLTLWSLKLARNR